jgi:hypothetical protein
VNNSRGPLNSSGNWWSIIKAYKDILSYHLPLLERIINESDDEELVELIEGFIEIFTEDKFHLHLTPGFTSGGSQGVGMTEETPLSNEEILELNEFTERTAAGENLTEEERKRQQDLLDNSGQVMQDNASLGDDYIMFTLTQYPGFKILAGPVTIAFGDTTTYGMQSGNLFKRQLREAIDNA